MRSIFQNHVFSPWSNFSDLPAVEITAEQIADIASSLVETHTTFFPDSIPRVAFLSYSTYESGVGVSVDKMKDAHKIFQSLCPDVESD